MQTTFNEMKLKKGQKVFMYGNWNGFENETIQYYIQEYTIHSIGKKRAYLVRGNDMAHFKYDCNTFYTMSLSKEQAIEDCKNYIASSIESQLNLLNNRLQYKPDVNSKYYDEKSHISYINHIQKEIDNINSANKEIIENPFKN